MSEAKKMDEKEFFRAMEEWMDEWHPSEEADRRALASRLGIELTSEEEEAPPGELEVSVYEETDRGGYPMIRIKRDPEGGDPWEGGYNWIDLSEISDSRPLPARELARLRLLVDAWNRRHQPPPEKIIAEEELAKRMFNAVNPGQDWINSLDKHSRERPWKTAARAALRALGLGIPEEEGEDSEEWSTQYMTPAPPSPKTTPGEVHLFDGDDMKTIAIPAREELADAAQSAYVNSEDDWAERWWNVADAAFRAFGLEPRKEEDHG